jgi:selenide,water dikinase
VRGAAPPVVDLVLLGGGHSHVQVLRRLSMRPMPGVRVTLVSRESFTPYSGMLPGHVAGLYDWRDIHIDLGPLARFAGARFVPDEVRGLDAQGRRLVLAGHPDLRYDLLSVNSGAVPTAAGEVGMPVKPIGRFLPRWREVRERAVAGERVTLIGGGAAGVELALGMRRTLPAGVELALLSDELMAGHAPGAVRHLRRALAAAGVDVAEGFRVRTAQASADATIQVIGSDERRHQTDHLFWVTGVEAPAWVAESGLATDERGFIAVDRHLRSLSHPEVFAAGDVAALSGQPRPKSGVFAVREGPVLTANLRRAVQGGRLIRYRAQRRALAIIGTGDGSAVASRGALWAAGRWVWRWKDWIDRRFMSRFNDLPDMSDPEPSVPRSLRENMPDTMRCGGCGAKLGADPLRRVLARLPDQSPLERRRGVQLGIGDDAAVVQVAAGNLVLTVDGFRSLVADPYRFGRITAHHSLNDVIAMGGQGLAALAMATVPLMAEEMMEQELYLLLQGVVEVLNEHDVPLVGGHSAEGGELSLALSITGVEVGPALHKGGARAGEALLLTKALGTGAVLAADMRARAPSDDVAAAVAAMDTSNAAALAVLREHGVSALTDVSGFGLVGHLGEMLRAAGIGASLELAAIPLLPGAAALVADGFVSSLQANNEAALQDFDSAGIDAASAPLRLLADPQTSGGLLAAVPADRAAACVSALQAAGYPAACRIGTVTDGPWQVTA